MKSWPVLILIACLAAGCASTEGLQAERPVSNALSLTGPYLTEGEVDQMPVPVRQVEPEFPSIMRRAKLDGTAFVVLVVSATGKPEQVQANQATHELFAEAAVRAVQQWEFKPGMKDGKPVATMITVPIQFQAEFQNAF